MSSASCTALHQATSSTGSNSGDSGTYESTTLSSVDSLLSSSCDDADCRIRQRLEASKQGMLQLEALRIKHQKLMEEVRVRWPHSSSETLQSYMYKNEEPTYAVPQNEGKVTEFRSDSPMSCCVSHRSSVSMDSGCASLSSDPSIQPAVPYSAYRKPSIEEQCKKADHITSTPPNTEETPKIVATAIESTTAFRCHAARRSTKNWLRPKSMCSARYPDENTVLVDSMSFSQITPPPVHRKFTTTGRMETTEQPRRACLTASCFDVRTAVSIGKENYACARIGTGLATAERHAVMPLSSQMSQIPSSPHPRLRNPQKPLQPARMPEQVIFHASRVFVDRSPRNAQKLISQKCPERADSDEDSSPQPYRAQPAVVLSRQHSYSNSNESSPTESRKMRLTETTNLGPNAVSAKQSLLNTRCDVAQCLESIISERPRRRMKEKDWKESEGL